MSANRFRLIGTKEQIEARQAQAREKRQEELKQRGAGLAKMSKGTGKTIVEYRVAYKNEHGATHRRKFKTLEAAQAFGKALGKKRRSQAAIDRHEYHSGGIENCYNCNFRYDLRLWVNRCEFLNIECRFSTEWESIEG